MIFITEDNYSVNIKQTATHQHKYIKEVQSNLKAENVNVQYIKKRITDENVKVHSP